MTPEGRLFLPFGGANCDFLSSLSIDFERIRQRNSSGSFVCAICAGGAPFLLPALRRKTADLLKRGERKRSR